MNRLAMVNLLNGITFPCSPISIWTTLGPCHPNFHADITLSFNLCVNRPCTALGSSGGLSGAYARYQLDEFGFKNYSMVAVSVPF